MHPNIYIVEMIYVAPNKFKGKYPAAGLVRDSMKICCHTGQIINLWLQKEL